MTISQIRGQLTREAIEHMRECEDHQAIVTAIYQDDRAIAAWPDDEKRESVAEGIASFAGHALGFTRY